MPKRETVSGATVQRDAEGRVIGFGKTFPRLETERLVLRAITFDDAAFWVCNFSDAEVAELTAFEAPDGIEGAKAEISEYCVRPFELGTGIRWGLVLKESGELVGTCGYHRWDHRNRNTRLGYDLLREHRRQGLMTEALREAIRFGFEQMDLNRIEALTDPRNVASIRLLVGLGFRKEGILREATFFRGRFFDDVCFSLLRRESTIR